MRPYIISGIDIGNSQVKVVIAKIDRDTLGAEILGVGNSVSNGLKSIGCGECWRGDAACPVS